MKSSAFYPWKYTIFLCGDCGRESNAEDCGIGRDNDFESPRVPAAPRVTLSLHPTHLADLQQRESVYRDRPDCPLFVRVILRLDGLKGIEGLRGIEEGNPQANRSI